MHITNSVCQTKACFIITECNDRSNIYTLHVIEESDASNVMPLVTELGHSGPQITVLFISS